MTVIYQLGPDPFMATIMIISFKKTPDPFEDLVTELDPDIRYDFKDGSGGQTNQGSTGSTHDTTVSGSPAGTYNADGQGQTGGAFEFDGGGRFITTANLPSDSFGTIWFAGTHNNSWNWDLFEGFDTYNMVLQAASTSWQMFYSGPGFNDDAFLTPTVHPVINDGDLHTFALRKNNDSNKPDMFIDGVEVATTVNEVGGGDTTQWLDDFGADLSLGGRGNPDSAGLRSTGIQDEWMYFAGTALTNQQISDLSASYFAQ